MLLAGLEHAVLGEQTRLIELLLMWHWLVLVVRRQERIERGVDGIPSIFDGRPYRIDIVHSAIGYSLRRIVVIVAKVVSEPRRIVRIKRIVSATSIAFLSSAPADRCWPPSRRCIVSRPSWTAVISIAISAAACASTTARATAVISRSNEGVRIFQLVVHLRSFEFVLRFVTRAVFAAEDGTHRRGWMATAKHRVRRKLRAAGDGLVAGA